jgi:hypothetical protein
VDAAPVAIDSDGNVHLTGMFDGKLDFGDGEISSAGGDDPNLPGDDLYVAKLDPDGKTLWSRMFGGPDFSGYTGRIAVTGDGRAVVSGMYWGSIDFGNGPLSAGEAAGPNSGLFVAALDTSGQAV